MKLLYSKLKKIPPNRNLFCLVLMTLVSSYDIIVCVSQSVQAPLTITKGGKFMDPNDPWIQQESCKHDDPALNKVQLEGASELWKKR